MMRAGDVATVFQFLSKGARFKCALSDCALTDAARYYCRSPVLVKHKRLVGLLYFQLHFKV
jgi:hypothetical protein